MSNMVTAIRWLLGIILFTVVSPAFSQDEERSFRINLGMDYTSGSYGADEKTEILYMPLSFQMENGPWVARAVVPWLSVSGPAIIIDGAEAGSAVARTTDGASGMGDLSFSLRYSFEQLYERNLFIDVTARAKIPTASINKGLGTGEADVAFQLDVAQAIGPFIPFATVGRKWVGVPDGFKLRNTFFGSLGLQYSWSDRVATGLSYDYRQSSFKNSSDPQEGLAYLNIRFSDHWSVNLYSVIGLSENSPDVGGGTAFVYRFP